VTRGQNVCAALARQEARTAVKRKRKEKTTLAVTATVSDSTAGISLEAVNGGEQGRDG